MTNKKYKAVDERFDKRFKVDEQTRLEGKDIIRHNKEIKAFIHAELDRAIKGGKHEN